MSQTAGVNDDLLRGFARVKAQMENGGRTLPTVDSSAPTLTIGRGPDCTWRVDDPYVSLLHATIYRRVDGSIWVRSEGALNGVFVNEVKVYDQPIRPGDVIRVGRTNLTVPA